MGARGNKQTSDSPVTIKVHSVPPQLFNPVLFYFHFNLLFSLSPLRLSPIVLAGEQVLQATDKWSFALKH